MVMTFFSYKYSMCKYIQNYNGKDHYTRTIIAENVKPLV